MNKICSVLMMGALVSSLVGCNTADLNDERTNRFQGYQAGKNDVQNTRKQTANNANGHTNITNNTNNTDTAQGHKGHFNDVPRGQWYTESIEWSKDVGIMGGYPGGSFQPNKPITRAEISAIIRNMAEKGYINVPDQTDQTPAADTTPEDTKTPGAATTPDTTTPGTDTTPDTTPPGT